ncbi:MAG: hypothetical protein DBP01_15360 [gamma proteobacterium symbiont of Ctena orbiculata]|nr:MAG: hypothetical protein DBP01_15360 [gamma proteobacterium symbiont of Ctena orbiculata]
MDFEWDPRKAAENLHKHGVDFADAVIALEDENALTIEDRDHPEQRFKTLGLGPDLKVLFVVHAERNENLIRIISARDADRSQTKQYYQGLSYE